MAIKRKRTSRRRFSRRKAVRRGSRRAFVRRGVSTVVSLQSPISDRYITRMNYTELVTFGYSGTLNYYQFNLNNVNDPNRSGTGHQPMGHDQLGTLYEKYRVIGCHYTIHLSNTNPAYQGEAVVLLRPDADTAATFEDAMESPLRKYRILEAEGGGTQTIKGYANFSKIFGVPRSVIMNDESYMAGYGGNPANQAVLTVYIQNQATGTALTVIGRVNLVYTVQWFERKMLSAS